MRGDLADVRLADRVFAPHYALGVARFATCTVAVRSTRDAGSDVLGMLGVGDVFEVLEFSSLQAWGTATALERVGYVDAECLSWVAP